MSFMTMGQFGLGDDGDLPSPTPSVYAEQPSSMMEDGTPFYGSTGSSYPAPSSAAPDAAGVLHFFAPASGGGVAEVPAPPSVTGGASAPSAPAISTQAMPPGWLQPIIPGPSLSLPGLAPAPAPAPSVLESIFEIQRETAQVPGSAPISVPTVSPGAPASAAAVQPSTFDTLTGGFAQLAKGITTGLTATAARPGAPQQGAGAGAKSSALPSWLLPAFAVAIGLATVAGVVGAVRSSNPRRNRVVARRRYCLS